MSSQALALNKLLSQKNPSAQQRSQILKLIHAAGSDLPDVVYQNSYILYTINPKSTQKYIQLQDLVYSGLDLKVEPGIMKKWVLLLKKRLGDNSYVRRMYRFVQYVTNGDGDVSPLQDLLRDDLSDIQTLKKTITSFKKLNKADEYIDRMNKYLSIEPLDEQAWLELAQTYNQKGHYMKSAFCYEQLVALNPANDVYTLRLSQLYLTLNNKSSTDKAVKYLTYLITKRPDNLRALWVLYRAILGNEEYQELREMCNEVINNQYSKKNQSLKINVAI